MATDAGDYAEGAAVVAAVLHFEVGAGAGILRKLANGFEDGGGEQFGVGEDVGDKNPVLSSQFPVLSKSGEREEALMISPAADLSG